MCVMAERKLRTWQEVLNRWDKWTQSVEETKETISNNCIDVIRMRERALDLHYQDEFGSLPRSIKAELGRLDKSLWDILNTVDNAGTSFITNFIRIHIGTPYFETFLSQYKKSIIPDLVKEWQEVFSFQEYLLESGLTHMWHDSHIDHKRRKGKVIDSVSWYRGKTDIREITERIPKMTWLSDEQVREQDEGGRPSEDHRKDMEGILCYVYHKRYGRKQEWIANEFNWGTYENDYGHTVSSTVKERLTRGRRLMKMYGYNKMT